MSEQYNGAFNCRVPKCDDPHNPHIHSQEGLIENVEELERANASLTERVKEFDDEKRQVKMLNKTIVSSLESRLAALTSPVGTEEEQKAAYHRANHCSVGGHDGHPDEVIQKDSAWQAFADRCVLARLVRTQAQRIKKMEGQLEPLVAALREWESDYEKIPPEEYIKGGASSRSDLYLAFHRFEKELSALSPAPHPENGGKR